ncbi:MAG TPA: carboxypeptidase regulatory-like domain-containing protein [Vicinamibacterales bacterium]|nr:carboxypeptidase regulatory-like domain-containing protein [Vicinamibacterales bacterium]
MTTFSPSGRRVAMRPWLIVGAVLLLSVGGATVAVAQSVSSGTIEGTIKDESGSVLPGATITATSPQLQVGQIVQVSDSSGNYKFVDLPPGTYRLKAELQGFSQSVRDELRLTVGFNARVDFLLKVGALEESVTVSGQSPVVDVTNTTASVALTKEVLDTIPRGRDLQNVFAMAPGVTQAVADVGGSTMAQRQNLFSYGVLAQPKLQVEGMNITMGADQNTAIYFNDSTLEEVQIKTSGNDAEVSVPGMSMVAIMKSGGNTFHGTYQASTESPKLQANNLTSALQAQGLTATSPLKNFYDVSADLGGRIVRDKLWFYGAYGRQGKTEGVVGFAASPGPDGKYLTADDPLADFETSLQQFSVKFSYQLSKNNRLIYAWQRGTKAQPENNADRFTPLESTRDYVNPTAIQKIELQSMLSPRVLVNAVGGYSGYVTDYDAARSYARADAPPRNDLATTLNTGSAPLHQNKTRDRIQSEDSVTFFPERSVLGHHEIKSGVSIYLDRSSDGYSNNLACNCILYTDTINGVPNTPSQIRIYNTPVVPADHANTYAWYVKDSWRPSGRVTLNLGLRWERQTSFLPAQSFGGARDWATVFPAGSYPEIDVQNFARVVPRAGVAWDVGAKSVVKATVGLYNYMLGDTYADAFNRNATANAVFTWHDLNGDRLYEPGEVNLDLNSTDFRSITAASNRILNPALQPPNTWETTASFEREMAPNLALRTMYVYKVVGDSIVNSTNSLVTVNTLRPFDAWSVPITRRDPGPDGVLGNADDAGKVTLYDYTAAYRGASFVNSQIVNAPNTDRYHAMEFTVTKRFSSRWNGQVSYFAVKNHRWIASVFTNPNDEFFPLDETWTWAGNVSASYRLPADFTVSGFLQSKNGLLGQRTYIFRQADPDGGPAIAQNGNTTIRLEPYGTRQLSAQNILNLRGSKSFPFGGERRLDIDFDVFNVLNAATPTAANFQSGPSFGYVTGVIPARIARLGVRFRF